MAGKQAFNSKLRHPQFAIAQVTKLLMIVLWRVAVNDRAHAFDSNPGIDHNTLAGRVALERQLVHIAGVAADPEFSVSEVVIIGNLRSLLGMPLLREGEPIGVLTLAH